jgi:hypothetical protein
MIKVYLKMFNRLINQYGGSTQRENIHMSWILPRLPIGDGTATTPASTVNSIDLILSHRKKKQSKKPSTLSHPLALATVQ